MYVCMQTSCMPGAVEARIGCSIPGTELHAVVSHHVGAWNCTSLRTTNALSH